MIFVFFVVHDPFVKVVFSPRYEVDIGLHVFPTRKYRLVRDRLLDRGVVTAADIVEPEPAAWDDLALVHASDYLEKLRRGTLTREDVAELELPWSEEMVDGFRVMVGGTIAAARLACSRRSGPPRNPQNAGPGSTATDSANFTFAVVGHLGGGLHHAFPNHGEGFCPFNDVAVAVRVLQRDLGLERIAVVDLDVHHGNGTAFIFETDPAVFTFSMHQQHNYPMWKPRGSLDVGLPDGARDDTFLRELENALPRVIAHAPECVFYLAGADPYEDDQLGGLRVTKEGLRRRDRLVIDTVRSLGVPLVIVLAGGYARHLEDTVAIHATTVEEAAAAT